MGTFALTVLAISVVLLLVQTVSLLSANEGFRGAGRVAGGISIAFLGLFLVAANLGMLVESAGTIIGLCGFVTFLSGFRKYMRRNVQQQ